MYVLCKRFLDVAVDFHMAVCHETVDIHRGHVETILRFYLRISDSPIRLTTLLKDVFFDK